MRYALLACLFLLMALVPAADRAAPGPPPGPLAARWKKIDQLLAKNQTATAAPLVEAIYQEAKAANNAPAYVRALLYKIRLLEAKENDADERAIALLERDLKTAGFPARPILHSLLAELYTNYLNQNRYRLYQRTAGAEATAEDTTAASNGADGGSALPTWDVGRLGSTIVRHYRQSVEIQPEKQLATTLAELGDLAAGGDAEGRALRPSLFDLLAHRAVAGLQNQELYITRPAEQFQATDAKLYGSAQAFAGLKLQGPVGDSLNGQLLALRVLQQLTAARLREAPQRLAALADVDLARLDYLNQNGEGRGLAAMAETYKALPIGTEFLARYAQALRAGSPAEALKVVALAVARFPDARGTRAAMQVRDELLQPVLGFAVADVVVANQPWRFVLTMRNVARVYATAYRLTRREWEQYNDYRQRSEVPFSKRYARALGTAPVATWEIDKASTRLTGPGLPPGHFLIFISSQAQRPADPAAHQVTCYGVLATSELVALHRPDPATGAATLLVLHRQTGVPVPNVPVQATFVRYNRANSKTERQNAPVQRTDAEGRVTLPMGTEFFGEHAPQAIAVRLWRGADTVRLDNVGGFSPRQLGQTDVPSSQTFLFSDRAIYRPGQTVYFKGIMTQTTGYVSRLETNQPVSVRLLDANGQTVQTLAFTSSAFGSFQGSVVLPTGRLNGQMSLQADFGSLGFLVEDYKRPTFLVTLDSLPAAPRPGEALVLTGRARAYAGPATDGATVRYRILKAQPRWFDDYGGLGGGYGYGGRGYYPPQGQGQELALGRTTTDAQGRFSIAFTPPAEADDRRKSTWGQGQLFEVVADVTDAAGETRTGTRTYAVGPQALSLRLLGPEAADKQQLPAFRLLAASATGQPRPAAGTLRLQRQRELPAPPDTSAPVPNYEDETGANGPFETLRTLPFDTQAGPVLTALPAALAALPPGRYRLQAEVPGPDTVRAELAFVLFDSGAATAPFRTPDWFHLLADTVGVGQPAALLLGSHHADARVLLEVESAGFPLRREWLTLAAGEQRRLVLAPNPAAPRAPLVVHTTQVFANRIYRHTATVRVLLPPQPLAIGLSTFRDKLRPGERETWRLTLRQANGQPAAAELLATLYDQSLDLFRPHGFSPLAFGEPYYEPRLAWYGNDPQRRDSRLLTLFRPTALRPPVGYPRLQTWLGQHYGLQAVTVSAYTDRPDLSGMAGEAAMGKGLRLARQAAPMADMAAMSAAAPAAPAPPGAAGGSAPPPDLSAIAARADFRETALWEPALHTDADGNAVLEFQMPEAVTRWQLYLLAHDKDLHTGRLARQLVTQKALQITPNAPRFFRQGDTFTFAAKVSNLTDAAVQGTAQLFLLDASTGEDVSARLLQGPAQQPAAAAARQSAALGWQVSLPADFAPAALTYRVVVSAQCSVPGAQAGQRNTKNKRNSESRALNAEPQKLSTKHQALSTKNETLSTKHQALGAEASTEAYTDGEQNTLPVLPNRVLVTESLSLPIVGPGTRTFELKKLTSTRSATRRNYALTLEATDNPAWYAVQSLPYLTDYPYVHSEGVFSRLYANLLAAHILRSNPRLKTVLAEWQRQAQSGPAAQRSALASKLAQNQELKSLLLQETPWVRDAQSETERLARLVTLFDVPRLQAETARALAQLEAMQLPSGAFPWFEQTPADRYLTQLIVAGFGKLKKLGAFDISQDEKGRALLRNALRYLDDNLAADLAALRRQKDVKLTADHLGDLQTQALYARSFWGPLPERTPGTAAFVFYAGQAARYWPGRPRCLQAQLALALFRADEKAPAAQEIMRGLAENALHSPELGMYWKDVQPGYYWREAPTETQATLIEAFSEVKNDQKLVDEMKLWLLKQKQVQHWASTRATADACYALLLRGSDWLAPAAPLQIQVGGETPAFDPGQAGTGYRKTTWAAAAITSAQGKVTLTKTDAGVAWGALYWQYFEDIDKLTPAATPLSLERQLYRETRTAAGPQLEKLTPAAPLKVGDVLVVRLVLRTDRALEYVHLKDQRAAGLEISQLLSGYRYQNGLGYYESPRDAATNFFLSEVPRGTHVFEYRLRASQVGDFSGGLSEVQCLYAPEFAAHSAGARLVIR